MEEYLRIESVKGRMILDSRSNPTVEAILKSKHYTVSASVPSGASTGKHEAKELRDKKKAYGGKGVDRAVSNITKISGKIKGLLVVQQEQIDREMIKLDGTKDKSKLGANATLAVSYAAAKAAALHASMPLYKWIHMLLPEKRHDARLPVPFSNVINGGRHAGNSLEFQEFMIAPTGAKSFHEATRMISETYHEIKELIEAKYGRQSTGLGDEGGFAPDIHNPEEALNLLEKAIENKGYDKKIKIAIDAAASEFFNNKTKKYKLVKDFTKEKSRGEMIDYYNTLVKHYPIISIEDPFHEEDFKGFSELLKKVKGKAQIVGDDLTVTNPGRIQYAEENKSCSALLLKPNQIGTLSEALAAADKAMSYGWNVMASHRSGETEEAIIADIAVAIGSGQIKIGAPARGERTAKYNQLLRLEDVYPKLKYGLLTR